MKNFTENKALRELVPALTDGKYDLPKMDGDFLELFVKGMFLKLDQGDEKQQLQSVINQL